MLMKIDMELVLILDFFKKTPDLLGGFWNIIILEQSSKIFNALYVFLFEIKLFRNFTPNKITIMLYKSYNSHTLFFFFEKPITVILNSLFCKI